MTRCRHLLLMVVLTAGCGPTAEPARVPVSGRVSHRGWPVRGGLIAFTPAADRGTRGPVYRGRISPGGEFVLLADGRPGVGPGWYRITVASLDGPGLPLRFRDPDQSGLVREVAVGGPNVFDIRLDGP